MSHTDKLAIITPIYPPAQGGAAVYYQLLCDRFVSDNKFSKIFLITEKNRMRRFLFHDRFTLVELFPERASSPHNNLLMYFLYAFQNLLYLFLPFYLLCKRVRVVLVHSSFHNYPNLLFFVTYILKVLSIKLILDVRDHQLPSKRAYQVSGYDMVFACSENVRAHLIGECNIPSDKIVLVPVIQENIVNSRQEKLSLKGIGVPDGPLVICVGIVKKLKGVELARDVFLKWKDRTKSTATLIFVGQIKDLDLAAKLETSNGVKCLGSVDRVTTLRIMRQAQMLLCCSESEGLPRSCLEAIAIGLPCLLPMGVPEFDKYVPDWVMRSRDVDELADQLEDIFKVPGYYADYPVQMHDIENVVSKYYEALFSLGLKT